MLKLVVAVLCLLALASGQKDPHVWPGRSAIVHLFEWKFSDVADECERFLAPKGYAGVQLSPVRENLVIPNRPWWERYQPVSYKIITRSGDEAAFMDMTRRCNDVGVRIYIDVTFNHMSARAVRPAVGTGGTPCDPDTKDYPGVPYTAADFHDTCPLDDFSDTFQVRFCELVGLTDLNQASDYVREKIVEYLDHLVQMGAAGFRVDAAKHMCPKDLYYIYGAVSDLNTDYGFAPGSRPFYYQEVIDYNGDEAITKYDYTYFGRVTEFKYGAELANAFKGNNPIHWLVNFGEEWGLMPDGDGLVFIDNHDTQRHGGDNTLTYKDTKIYKMAIGFMLAWPHGYPRIMSSFAFTDPDAGPPQDANENIISPSINPDDTCGNGWVCEHRWRQIYDMVGFRNAVEGTQVGRWWDNGNKHIAFARGDKGYVAFNDGDGDLQEYLLTNLPAGSYCDVISGRLDNGACTGKVVDVGADGTAFIEILESEEDGLLAIHVNAVAGKSVHQQPQEPRVAVVQQQPGRAEPPFPECT